MLDKCRVCQSSEITKLYPFKKKFTIYHCSNCNTDLVDPIASQEDIELSTNEDYFESYDDPSIKDFKVLDFKKILSEVDQTSINSALEVGCANAYITEHLVEHGKEAYGIELFPEIAAAAQKKFKDHRIFVGDFETFDFGRKFDLLIMFDLMEHVKNPQQSLDKASELLNSGGYIFILTPNIDAVKRKIMRQFWNAYYVEHINCFSRKSMEHLAGKAGLELYKFKRFKKTVNLRYFIRKLIHKFSVFAPLKLLLKTKINPMFTINDDSMMVILRKP